MEMRPQFEEDLRVLKNFVLTMSSQILQNYRIAMSAIAEKDEERLKQLIEDDKSVNNMERQIESKCLSLITKQQPVASDLRTISASLKMVTDLERVGHHVADICELALRLQNEDIAHYSKSLMPMAGLTGEMLASSIACFTMRNSKEAKTVIEMDDKIDDYFNLVKFDLVEAMIQGDQNEGARPTDNLERIYDACIDILMFAKYLEKIGDHATNIGEWTLFLETGDLKNQRIL